MEPEKFSVHQNVQTGSGAHLAYQTGTVFFGNNFLSPPRVVNIVWYNIQITKLLIMHSSQFSCYFLSLRSKYQNKQQLLPGTSLTD
jgi:hypothetical protein